MRVPSWMQSMLHGARKPAPSAHAPGDFHLLRDGELDGWAAAMLSIGTFGTAEGHGLRSRDGRCTAGAGELARLEAELRLLVRANTVAGAEDNGIMHRIRLPLKWSLLGRTSSSKNGASVVKMRQRSFRKLVAGAFSGFLPRPSFRERTMPEFSLTEIPLSLLCKNTHSEATIEGDPTVQIAQNGTAWGEEQEGNWIRTDSEYIVLEI